MEARTGGRGKQAGRGRRAEAEGEDGGVSGGEPTVGDRGGDGGRQAETEAGNSQVRLMDNVSHQNGSHGLVHRV